MIPFIDGKTLKSIDERAESEYGITLVQLMEVAGTRMAEFLRASYRRINNEEVLIICGKGNNGGDGLVAARVLHNWGKKVKVLLAFPEKDYLGVPLQQLHSCKKHGLEIVEYYTDQNPYVIVDCLFGFGFQGELKPSHRELVQWMNQNKADVFSCDLPSGMNSTEFSPDQLTVQADCTLTFTVPKEVFRSNEARQRAGEIYILDIGIPMHLYQEIGVENTLFKKSSWVRW